MSGLLTIFVPGQPFAVRDQFTTAAASLPALRAAEPGPGAMTVTDTGGKYSTAGGKLVIGTLTSSGADPRQFARARTRLAGRAVFGLVNQPANTSYRVGFNANGNTGPTTHSLFLLNGTLTLYRTANALAIETGLANDTDYEFAIILRAIGAHYLIKGGAFATWTRVWVDNTVSTASLLAGHGVHSTQSASSTLDNFREVYLTHPWTDDWSAATQRRAVSVADEAITMTPNALVEHTITAATGVTQELIVRETDASNKWIVRCVQSGTVKLIEVVAGAETERHSTAQTWTNGTAYRVVVTCDGTVIQSRVATAGGNYALRTNYASASTHQAATIARVSHAGVDFASWARNPTLPDWA